MSSEITFRNPKFLERFDGKKFRDSNSSGIECVDEVVKQLVKLLPLSGNVLESCSGYGEYLYPLSETSFLVDAVEIDQVAFAAQPRYQSIRYFQKDFFEFMWGGYDAIICNPPFRGNVYSAFVDRCLDKLAPGGILVLHQPLLWDNVKYDKIRVKLQAYKMIDCFTFYDGAQRVWFYQKEK